MSDNSKFRKGLGVYTCSCCGKQTRETGKSESFNGLCAYCLEEGEWENALSDGDISEEQFDKIVEDLKIKYNRK